MELDGQARHPGSSSKNPHFSADIRAQLDRLTSRPPLSSAERLRALLRFVVLETLDGRGESIKETRIGLEVFGRDPATYDPAVDPIVRVQMGRLRSKLRRYYSDPASAGEPRILIEPGSYVPVFGPPGTRARESAGGMESRGPAPAARRIAVLPMIAAGVDEDATYLCDGVTEELAWQLSRIPGLRIVARTSALQFKNAARDIREIGRLLDVDAIVEGSLRRSDEAFRLTVQLISVEDGCHLWSGRHEGKATDLFEALGDMTSALARAVSPGDDTAATRRRTGSTAVYNCYLQGRYLWKQRTEHGVRAALGHFARAADADPSFVRALSGIADCHLMLGLSAADAPERTMPTAADAAARALALDPSLAEAHASLAVVRNCYDWNFAAAAEGYRRAIALDPTYATAWHWQGLFLHAPTGRFDAALESLEEAIDLDPLSPPIVADLAIVQALRGDLESAAASCRRAAALDPRFHRPLWFLGLAEAWNGHYDAAADALARGIEFCPGAAFRPRLLGALGYVEGRRGNRARVIEIRDALEEAGTTAGYLPAFEMAQLEIGSGNHAAALSCLEAAVARRESFLLFLPGWGAFAPLRGQPRYAAILASLGLG